MQRDVKELVDGAAASAVEDWAYNSFSEDSVEGCADVINGTFLGSLSKGDQLSLAEDRYGELGETSISWGKGSSLSSEVEFAASAEVDRLARELFLSEAKKILKLKETLEESYAHVSICKNDYFGWTQPHHCEEKGGMSVYCYRLVEGDINADSVNYISDESKVEVWFTCYLKQSA